MCGNVEYGRKERQFTRLGRCKVMCAANAYGIYIGVYVSAVGYNLDGALKLRVAIQVWL